MRVDGFVYVLFMFILLVYLISANATHLGHTLHENMGRVLTIAIYEKYKLIELRHS